MTRARYFLILAAGIACPGTALAQSETSASAQITTSAGYSANPFAGRAQGSNGSSGYVELRVDPTLSYLTPRDTFRVSGDAQIQQYFQRYSTRDNYNVRGDYTGRWSTRLTTTASVSYSNTISGSSFGSVGAPPATDPANPVPVPPVVSTDLGLFGSGNRSQTINGQLGFTLVLSGRDQVNAYGSAVTTSNSRPGVAIGYHSFGGGFGYQRRLNDSISVGVTGSATTSSYDGAGESSVYSVQATVDGRVNEHWTINGGLGFSRLDGSSFSPVFGATRAQTTVSGNITLCRRGDKGLFCLDASRAVLPSSFGGARAQSLVDATYSRRLSERASANVRASFTQVDGNVSGAGVGIGQGSAYRYWTTSVGYQHRLRERLSLSATASYRKVSGGQAAQADDYSGQVGITYAIGKAR